VLETRVMVKSAMKTAGSDAEDLLPLFNARQFALKMIANVTYGFTSASFSGRMPCAGLADAIVQCGRDTLEKMIQYVNTELSEETGASVVYGDTDSLFVRVPGTTKEEAFAVGRRIAAKAAAIFPKPIKLQLEKVYHPCVLLTKKRYVGYAYDSETTTTPVFDAKGIETVRRDSCGIVQKTMEAALRMLFEVRDVSRVKRMVMRTWQRVITGRVPLSLFIFRKEVRLGTYKDLLPPAAVVATRELEADPRAAPRHGERVAFVVTFGGPGAKLKDCVVAPHEMLEAELSGSSRIHSTYYITKQMIPALHRIFSLIGASVASWYAEMPRAYFEPRGAANVSRIQTYFPTARPCLLCRGRCVGSAVCANCRSDSGSVQVSHYVLSMRQRALEERRARLHEVCLYCVGGFERDERVVCCHNMDCTVRFEKQRITLREELTRRVLDDKELWELA
jgi:DNA polymerase zeta